MPEGWGGSGVSDGGGGGDVTLQGIGSISLRTPEWGGVVGRGVGCPRIPFRRRKSMGAFSGNICSSRKGSVIGSAAVGGEWLVGSREG